MFGKKLSDYSSNEIAREVIKRMEEYRDKPIESLHDIGHFMSDHLLCTKYAAYGINATAVTLLLLRRASLMNENADKAHVIDQLIQDCKKSLGAAKSALDEADGLINDIL